MIKLSPREYLEKFYPDSVSTSGPCAAARSAATGSNTFLWPTGWRRGIARAAAQVAEHLLQAFEQLVVPGDGGRRRGRRRRRGRVLAEAGKTRDGVTWAIQRAARFDPDRAIEVPP